MRALEVRRHTPATPWTYRDLDRRQKEIAERVRAGGEGALLLSEVAPVVTVGRRTPESDVFAPPGLDVVRVDRGGLATWHGPGQWVLFAVDSLERLTGDPRGVRKAVCALLQVGRLAAASYFPDGLQRYTTGEGEKLGVWGPKGKVAALGVHVSQGVLQHGLSLNGFRTPQSFQGLRPCGLDTPVDYVLSGPDAAEGFEELGQRLVGAAFEELWG